MFATWPTVICRRPKVERRVSATFSAPKMRIPYAVAYAAGVASTAWAGITGREPLAPLDGVRMAKKKMWVRHEKASRELGFSPGPAPVALRRAVEWFRANGYC